MGSFGNAQAHALEMLLYLSEVLLKGIPEDRFARLPVAANQTIETNHPAFVFGHLSLYPARLEALARGGPALDVDASYLELFSASSTCVDDPDGSRYPARDAIIEQYTSGYRSLIVALREMDDEQASKANTDERWKERYPSIGDALAFIGPVHTGFHLGQVSAWRRAEGMPSAM
ncbi:MAG: DinB family protein [Planctomycetota bacterium]